MTYASIFARSFLLRLSLNARERGLLSASDNLVLEVFSEVDEVVAVAGDADDQVLIFLRPGPGFVQGLGVHDIELDVVAVGTAHGITHEYSKAIRRSCP